ncbi:hypothetical protein [Nonomuraea sp. NPDC049646]|uniref:hypothetical protein n=1 Tax=unclassified Nonomuraea TaxID=2593643 RepID=UPI00378F7D89
MIVVGFDGSASSYAAVRGPGAAEHALTAAGHHQTPTGRGAGLLDAPARRARDRRPVAVVRAGGGSS